MNEEQLISKMSVVRGGVGLFFLATTQRCIPNFTWLQASEGGISLNDHCFSPTREVTQYAVCLLEDEREKSCCSGGSSWPSFVCCGVPFELTCYLVRDFIICDEIALLQSTVVQ